MQAVQAQKLMVRSRRRLPSLALSTLILFIICVAAATWMHLNGNTFRSASWRDDPTQVYQHNETQSSRQTTIVKCLFDDCDTTTQYCYYPRHYLKHHTDAATIDGLEVYIGVASDTGEWVPTLLERERKSKKPKQKTTLLSFWSNNNHSSSNNNRSNSNNSNENDDDDAKMELLETDDIENESKDGAKDESFVLFCFDSFCFVLIHFVLFFVCFISNRY